MPDHVGSNHGSPELLSPEDSDLKFEDHRACFLAMSSILRIRGLPLRPRTCKSGEKNAPRALSRLGWAKSKTRTPWTKYRRSTPAAEPRTSTFLSPRRVSSRATTVSVAAAGPR